VIETFLAVAELADHVPELARFGRVLRDGVSNVVELFDDVIVDRVPQIVHSGHGWPSFLTRRNSAV
jgi:hypothetical protein